MSLTLPRSCGHLLLPSAWLLVACQTPGEDFQGVDADTTIDSGMTSSATMTNTVTTSSSSGGAGNTVTDGGATTQGGTQANTTDASTTDSPNSTSTEGSTTGSGGSGGGATNTGTEGTTGSSIIGNVVDNGDFESSSDPCASDETDWSLEGEVNWSGGDDEICGYCIVLDPNQSGQLNWSGNAGTPPTLAAGSYSFSVDVISNDGTPPSLRVKVGQPVEPYAAFLEEEVSVGGSTSTFSQSFSLSGSDQVGIAFFVSAGSEWGKICFDNVSIAPE